MVRQQIKMATEGPCVELAPGSRALGRSMPLVKGCTTPVYAFLGLPYAEPPVGSLRFQPPQPTTLWSGDRDATKHGAVCPQDMAICDITPIKLIAPTSISEDCLFLNVWTRTLDASAKKPVMVFIHGGGFAAGFSDTYYGSGLVSLGDVVVVTLNYRLNIFGFMTTGDEICQGNYGILDQIEALRWVQKHIRAFGGDPDNVTIFGESAGSMSVAALLMTSLSRGLFHRAICQSGTVKSPNILLPAKVSGDNMKPLLKRLDCKCEKSEDIVEFLRQIPADELFKAIAQTDRFCLVLDDHVFFEKDLWLDGNELHPQVDTIIGCNSHEGAMFANMLSQFQFPDMKAVTQNMSFFVLSSYGAAGEAAIADMVQEYFDEGMSEDELAKAYVEWCGDFLFSFGSVKTALAQAQTKGSNYMYWYAYRDATSVYPDWVKADHGAEIDTVFGMFLFDMSEQLRAVEELPDTAADEEISRKMIAYWTNFAKTGNPNGDGLPHWPLYTRETQEHIVMDNEFSVGSHMVANRIPFWEKMIKKYPNV